MAVKKGPFTLKWGENTLAGIEEVKLEIEPEENEFTTIQGNKFKIQSALSGTVEITLLDTDMDALKAVLPQYHVIKTKSLTNGKAVKAEKGAIEFSLATCSDAASVKYDLDILSCDGSGTRLVSASSAISGVEISDNVRKVSVKFTAEPGTGKAPVQFLEKEEFEA
jgi:hypothetical protein